MVIDDDSIYLLFTNIHNYILLAFVERQYILLLYIACVKCYLHAMIYWVAYFQFDDRIYAVERAYLLMTVRSLIFLTIN